MTVVVLPYTTVSADGWSNIANLIDGLSGNTVGSARFDWSESLRGTGLASLGGYSGTISKVRIGVRASSGDAANTTCKLRPYFNGATAGNQNGETAVPGALTILWYDITSTYQAPSTWTWADVQNLDVDIEFAYRGENDVTVDVDYVAVEVTYTPPVVIGDTDTVTLYFTSGTATSAWSNASHAFGSSADGEYAYIVGPVDSGEEYLQTDVLGTLSHTEKIVKVEVGVRYGKANGAKVHFHTVFDGTFGSGGDIDVGDDTTTMTWKYVDVTNTTSGPGDGNWTWTDIGKLAVQLYLEAASGETVDVDVLCLRVTISLQIGVDAATVASPTSADSGNVMCFGIGADFVGRLVSAGCGAIENLGCGGIGLDVCSGLIATDCGVTEMIAGFESSVVAALCGVDSGETIAATFPGSPWYYLTASM